WFGIILANQSEKISSYKGYTSERACYPIEIPYHNQKSIKEPNLYKTKESTNPFTSPNSTEK
ncbi:MAG: hypothetical protein ACW99F_18830, partial [Candidatus Hodarchaeales archaeon]